MINTKNQQVSDDLIKGIGSSPNNKEQDDNEIICDTPYKNALEQLPEPEQDSDDESDIFQVFYLV